MQQDIYMTTGEFARMMRVSKDTLFHYDKIGLLKPDIVKSNGYRYYSVYQADLLEAIFMLRDLGMPLKEIQEHLTRHHPQAMDRLFAERELQIDREIAKLQSMKRWLRWNRERIQDAAEIDTSKIMIKTLPERYYLYSKMTDGTAREIYMKSSRLIGQLMKAEPEAVYHFAVLQHRSNIDAGQYNSYDNTMVLLGKQPSNIPYRTLAPGRYLTGYHKGAWDTVGEAYERMLAYSREQEISLQEEFVERYVIDGFTASSEEDFITEITVGIAEEGE